ncbi:hypothetical protein HDU86_002221 [Geranomyces michiganensis]|nr:hypothetical protein HDU86_002221 [Geranomyces michiganensis]
MVPAHTRSLADRLARIFDDSEDDELERVESEWQAKVKQQQRRAAAKQREQNGAGRSSSVGSGDAGAVDQRARDPRPLYERLFSISDVLVGEGSRVVDRPLVVPADELTCPPNGGEPSVAATPVVSQAPAAPAPAAKKPRLLAYKSAEDSMSKLSTPPETKKRNVKPVTNPVCEQVAKPAEPSPAPQPPESDHTFVVPLAERIKTNRRTVIANPRFSPPLVTKKKRKAKRKSDADADDDDGNNIYEVEKILDVRMVKNLVFQDTAGPIRNTTRGDKRYLIHWRGYPDPKEFTWEPEENLANAARCLREFWFRRRVAEREWAVLGMVTLIAVRLRRSINQPMES